jgi:hypothetical protein
MTRAPTIHRKTESTPRHARIWPAWWLCVGLALCTGLPGTAQADPAPQPAAARASERDYANDDADLKTFDRNPCGDDDTPLLPAVTYDYSFGQVKDTDPNNHQALTNGSDSSHRLLVRGLVHDCAGLLLSHLSSHTPPPGGAESLDSAALVAMFGGETYDIYLGAGETYYRGLQGGRTFDLFFHVRKQVQSTLGVELNVSSPFNELFSSSSQGHALVELAVRLDWRNIALRVGGRTYLINAIHRSSNFAGITFKY